MISFWPFQNRWVGGSPWKLQLHNLLTVEAMYLLRNDANHLNWTKAIFWHYISMTWCPGSKKHFVICSRWPKHILTTSVGSYSNTTEPSSKATFRRRSINTAINILKPSVLLHLRGLHLLMLLPFCNELSCYYYLFLRSFYQVLGFNWISQFSFRSDILICIIEIWGKSLA